MRKYLREGDLVGIQLFSAFTRFFWVSAEVRTCFQGGSLSLHARNLKYGKLGQGLLIKVLPHIVKRRKSHFCNLHFGASIIVGCNGYVWISHLMALEEGQTGR